MYIALKWDHQIGAHFVSWLVVECSSVTEKFGLPQALPPRRDIAYFVDEKTAEQDAKVFAHYKNTQQHETVESYSPYLSDHHGYCHYEWDHSYFSDFIRHAVLYWEDGHHEQPSAVRSDVGYFICPDYSETDSHFFARYKLSENKIKESG